MMKHEQGFVKEREVGRAYSREKSAACSEGGWRWEEQEEAKAVSGRDLLS